MQYLLHYVRLLLYYMQWLYHYMLYLLYYTSPVLYQLSYEAKLVCDINILEQNLVPLISVKFIILKCFVKSIIVAVKIYDFKIILKVQCNITKTHISY